MAEWNLQRATGITALALLLAAAALACFAPAPAIAHHVACGAVVTVDTTLDSDLLDCPRNGLEIGPTGSRSTWAATPSAAGGDPLSLGIGVTHRLGVTIRNGTISGFGTGVSLFRTTKSTVGTRTRSSRRRSG